MPVSYRNQDGTPIPAGHGDEIGWLRLQQADRARSRRNTKMLVAAVVLLPAFITAIFVAFIASPMYAAETRLAVRGSEDAPSSGIASLLAPSGAGAGLGGFIDGYAVRDFLQSRQAMQELRRRYDLQAHVANRGDFLVRTPAHPDDDQIYDAYRALVNVRYNMIEQILVVQVSGFSPESAVEMAIALVKISDEFVSHLNRRARDDALTLAMDEVARAEQRSAAARLDLAAWRNDNANVDPSADVLMLTNLIAQLETQLTNANATLAQIEATGNLNHPRRKAAQLQVATLSQQILDIRGRLTGNDATLTGRLSAYEGRKIAQDFSDMSLASARQSLEIARQAVLKRQRYVAVIAEPTRDGRPVYPQRAASIAMALLAGVALAFGGSVVLGLIRTALLA